MKTRRSWLVLLVLGMASLACSLAQPGASPTLPVSPQDQMQAAQETAIALQSGGQATLEALGGDGSASNSSAPLPPPNYEAQAIYENTYKIGVPIHFNDFILYVLQWNRHASEYDGRTCIDIDFILVNLEQESQYVDSHQFALMDQNGSFYGNMDNSSCNDDWPGRYVDAGERVRGRMSYLDPGADKHPYFVFPHESMDYAVQGERAYIDLGPAPSAAAALPLIEGEKQAVLHQIGETVALGEYRITLLEFAPVADPNDVMLPGYRAYRFTVKLENLSGQDALFQPDFFLKDSQGWEYGYDSYVIDDTFIGSFVIPAGGFFQGQNGFSVPPDASGLVFAFDANYVGYPSVYYALP